MDFLIITISNLVWVLYSMLEGIRESFFNNNKILSKKRNNTNIKRLLFLQRSMFLLISSILMFYLIGIYSIPITIGQILIFRYFHKLCYNLTTNNIVNKKEDEEIKKVRYSLLFGVTMQVFIYIFML